LAQDRLTGIKVQTEQRTSRIVTVMAGASSPAE
jgi:hypothetical protein